MFKDIKKNRLMVEGAYRKLKSYYYYNKNFLLMRKKIAEFEFNHEQMDKTFSNLANCLCHPQSRTSKVYLDSLVAAVDFFALPKKFDSEAVSGNKPVSNTVSRDKKLKTVNFFIDGPIELYILDTLWTVFLAKIDNDNHILSYDVYGNTINASALFADDNIDFENRLLFNRYFFRYTDWRNNAFQKLEDNYNKRKDSLLISLDIKSFFYSVKFNFDKLDNYFGDHALFKKIRPLTIFMQRIYSAYLMKVSAYRVDLPKQSKHSYILPIGLFSSMILGNIYLAEFDKSVHKQNQIIYYGRYVDDMLFVVNKSILPEDVNTEIIKEVFVDTGILDIKDTGYSLHGYPDLLVQAEKVKLLYVDHRESKAIIDIYNDTIRIIPSQMDPIPESGLNLSNFDEIAYTVENFTKEAKLRDLGRIGIDPFKVGRYFASLAHQYAHVSTFGNVRKEIDQHIEQIEKFFVGSQGVEFYSNWLNYMYFLVITQSWKQLRNFVTNMRKQISMSKSTSLERKMYARTASINKKAKETLSEHLNICLCLALSLDSDMVDKHFRGIKQQVQAYKEANLFDHSLIAFPLANYLTYESDVSYIKMSIKDIGIYPPKIEESFKFIWSPRFVHYDELLLLLFYHYHRINSKGNEFNYVRDGLVSKFMAINHMRYEPFSIDAELITQIDDYCLRKIRIPTHRQVIPDEVNIAVGSLSIDKQKCMNGCKRWENITLSEKEILNNILRESFHCFDRKTRGAMLLVLPELCFPIYWIGDLIRFAKQSQIAIVAGLQYMGDDSGRMYNYVVTILPFTSGRKRYKNVFVHIREKNDYSPIEFEGLAKLGYSCRNREIAEYQLFSWQGINLSPLVCYEMTDVMVRALLKGKCDIIAAPVFNPDTTYFSNIIDSTVRDLHAFIVQANTSFYGDSRVTGPYDRDSKDIFKIKGGDNDHVVIGSISFKKVKDFEKTYHTDLQKKVTEIMEQRGKKRKDIGSKKKTKPDIKPLSARFKTIITDE